ncbi:MAG TPA: heavy-metal-associated domain-containing protein [Thermomicrobiaceae bacterium]|nr:heavy-metal-associated domain-containing protein [Thermomicrobiaceae bacterium]
MATAVLKVPDISCEHCERTVKQALGQVAGVTQVSVDIPDKEVTVDYDDQQVGIDRLRTVLAEEDYPVAAVAQVK